MGYINKKDTNGTKGTLLEGELGYDAYTDGGDVGRVYVGTGSENIALSQKRELDAVISGDTDVAYDNTDSWLVAADVKSAIDELANSVKQVDTIADLRLMTYTPSTVYVTGYHTAGDGAFGSNIFVWDATSVEDDNDGTIIKLTGVETGRYKLQYSGSAKASFFGDLSFLHGSGTTAENNSFTGAVGEVVVDTTNKELRVHDGVTPGGKLIGAREVATIAAFRLLTDTPNKVYVAAYDTSGTKDGVFGSTYYTLLTDIGQVDNGGTIIRTAAGVYGLKYSGFAYPEWFGADATGATESTTEVQACFDNCTQVWLNHDSTFLVNNLDMTCVVLLGNGKLKKISNGTDGIILTLSTPDRQVEGITVEKADDNTGFSLNLNNDAIRIQNTTNARVVGVNINGSDGGGISLYSSNRCKILNNTIVNVKDNGVLIANLGADDNLVHGNTIDGTVSQNGIFLTASSGSVATVNYIYNNTITDNNVKNCGDTAFESGIHTVGTIVKGNTFKGLNQPCLLFRDSLRCKASGNTLITNGSEEAISVVPQTEGVDWQSDITIHDNTVDGAGTRAWAYIGQSGVSLTKNKFLFDGVIAEDLTNCTKPGIVMGGVGLSNITIEDNESEGTSAFLQPNYAATVGFVVDNLIVRNNKINKTVKIYNFYSTTFNSSVFDGNSIKTVTDSSFFTDVKINNGYIADTVDTSGSSASITPAAYIAQYRNSFFPLNFASKVMSNINTPVAQYSATVLLGPISGSLGDLTVSLEIDDAEYAVINVNTLTPVFKSKSSNIYANIAGFAGWGIGIDGSNQLLLQRRGATTTASKTNIIYDFSNK